MNGLGNCDTPAGSSRLDRLLQLLEHAGTAPGVRLMAARQIAAHVEGCCGAEGAIGGEGESSAISAITPIINKLVKLVLSSKSWDVRAATASSLEQSLAMFARHQHGAIDSISGKIPPLPLGDFCLQKLADQYEPLAASSGAEFELDLNAMSTADRLRQQRGQLKKTLDFMEGISDLASELIEDRDLMTTMDGEGLTEVEVEAEEEALDKTTTPPRELSARERAMLRRKAKNGNVKAVPRKPPAKLEIPIQWTEVAHNHLLIRTLLALRANILNATWTVRHGALLAIKEICGSLGASLPGELLPILARETLGLLALDRFNDFVSDQTVAPCRETAAQLLALLFVHCRAGDGEIDMKQWIWHQSLQLAAGRWEGRWQIRHGGLLCLKYLVAVDADSLQGDQAAFDRLYVVASQGCSELEDEDIKCLGAELLSMLIQLEPGRIVRKPVRALVVALLRDVESTALLPALQLLEDTITTTVEKESAREILLLLAQRLRHPSGAVRIKSLSIMSKLDMGMTLTDEKQSILLLRMLVQCILLDEEQVVWELAKRIAEELISRIVAPSADLLAAYVALCSIILTPRTRPFEKRHFVFLLESSHWETTCEPAAHEIGFRVADLMLKASPDGEIILAASRHIAASIVVVIGERWYDERVRKRMAQALLTSSDGAMVGYFGTKLFGSCAEVDFGSHRDSSDDIWYMRLALATGNMDNDTLKKYLALERAIPLCQDLALYISHSWRWGTSHSAFLLNPILDKESRPVALKTLSMAFAKADGEYAPEMDIMQLLGWHLIRAQNAHDFKAELLEKALLVEEELWESGLSQDLFVVLAQSHTERLIEILTCQLLPLLALNFDTTLLLKRRLMSVLKEVFAAAGECMSPFSALFVVPTLRRIADSDGPTREAASALFGDLLRLAPIATGGNSKEKEDPGHNAALLPMWKEAREFLSLFMAETNQVSGSQKRAQAMPPYQIPVEIRAHVRPYQQAGINWLAFLRRYGLHGALCDDMGLGKTLQTIVILASNYYEREEELGKRDDSLTVQITENLSIATKTTTPPMSPRPLSPSLIVCPASLVGHWKHEIETFAPSLGTPLLYVGSANERRAMWPRHREHSIVITSYETVRSDLSSISSVFWDYIVLDEGHVIKNPRTKLTLAIKSLRGERRLLLSGTPIQNNVIELWSLFDFLMPGMLGTTETTFMDRYGKAIMAVQPKMTPMGGSGSNGPGVKEFEEAERRLRALHKQVLPFILRRMKEDVLTDLPPKIIQDYECEPSALQRRLCQELERQIGGTLDEGQESLLMAGDGEKKKHVFAALQSLRKVCVHPRLLESNEQLERALKETGDSLTDLAVAPKLLMLKELLLECGIGDDNFSVGSSGEDPSAMASIAPSSVGHRVLLFAQHQATLNLIEELVLTPYFPRTRHLRLDGSVEQRDRFAIAQRFNADSTIELLLLTTSVGGLGLNLTGADTVIFVEHDWNPMRDLQAMDRAHRLGQRRVVTVYRLIVRDTFEQQVMGLQKWKTRVAATIVQQQNLQGADHEKLASTGLLDLLGEESTGRLDNGEPGSKRPKADADKTLAKLGVPSTALFPADVDTDPLAETTLAEYSKAFDINSFLKSVNQ